MISQQRLQVSTSGRGFYEITGEVARLVASAGSSGAGLCHVFVRHTSASLLICENADPDVLRDMEAFMATLVADGSPLFSHTAEGADDMAAHIRSVLTGSSLSLPIQDGRLALGTWQGLFLWEHRYAGHQRELLLTLHTDEPGI